MSKPNKPSKSKAVEIMADRSRSRSRTIKHATSFKLTDTALSILAELAIERGIAKSAVIENLLRDARRRG